MKTATIQIANTDDMLNQLMWSYFVKGASHRIRKVANEIHFHGGSSFDSPWQNACWVILIEDDMIQMLYEEMKYLCRDNNFQYSIAVTIGDTELIYGY